MDKSKNDSLVLSYISTIILVFVICLCIIKMVKGIDMTELIILIAATVVLMAEILHIFAQKREQTE